MMYSGSPRPSGFPPPPPRPPIPPLPQQQPPHLPPWLAPLLSGPPSGTNPLWNPENLQQHLKNLLDNLNLLKSMKKELETLLRLKESSSSVVEESDEDVLQISEAIGRKSVSFSTQESLSVEAAKALIATLKVQLEPFSLITSQNGPWEERSETVRLAQKLQKYKRNKRWKKRKRRRVAEILSKKREMYDKADQDADEWRAREIAKDIAKRKMEKMKEIAKLKANEERKRLEAELELVVVVEKLQELRNIRIQKLKKQGHFLPEEDNEFLERVRAAVEEEERQAAAAADTDAAKDAIASAEEFRKSIKNIENNTKDAKSTDNKPKTGHEPFNENQDEISLAALEPEQKNEVEDHGGIYDSLYNLPLEFYHYYHGSNYDMGTLIEVRRAWDTYIRPGGSRIPGYWVRPPPPSSEVWASYLMGPRK